jgi:type I restriction enzyme R subunit
MTLFGDAGNIFFTIFQTFMSGRDAAGQSAPSFGDYPPDFFDLIIIDECHRGGANDEGNWRGILDYFAPAVQLGLTATPKRRDNVDTYKYFGEPVYIYSLKEGINDGFLTPFKVKQIATMLAARERYRVKLFMDTIDQSQKTLVFCATQDHALAARDLVNQMKTSKEPTYCVRVTARDGALGELFLRTFQDNEKTIPTILTTSQKLSTGVDARNVRNIVLMRPINSIIEFKQIIGRGTRLFDGKDYFTIYDFVKAYEHFSDPEWDGEPAEPVPPAPRGAGGQPQPGDGEDADPEGGDGDPPRPQKIKIKLADGKERVIQHMMATTFWSVDGRPMSAAEFVTRLFGELPALFKDEDELRTLWRQPDTRKALLESLAEKGYGGEQLHEIERLIDAEKSDLYDVLAYIAFALSPITRQERADASRPSIISHYDAKLQSFLDFVLSQYVKEGVGELDQAKLPHLLELKYRSVRDAAAELGSIAAIRNAFVGFQQHLYN